MPSRGRDNKQYRDLSDALRRRGRRLDMPCWLCGHPIDYDLDWRHPMSYTYDHEDPIATGGAVRGVGHPAHRSCNSRRGADAKRVTPPTVVTTREW